MGNHEKTQKSGPVKVKVDLDTIFSSPLKSTAEAYSLERIKRHITELKWKYDYNWAYLNG